MIHWNGARWLALLALAVLLAPGLTAQAPAVGAVAPDFTLAAADGHPVHLADVRSKGPVVLLFMRGFTGEFACFYCGEQTRAYKAAYDTLRQAGAEVLLILPGAHDGKGFLAKVGAADEDHPDPAFAVPFPVLVDPDLKVTVAYGVAVDRTAGATFPVSNPATVVIDREGRVAFVRHGANPSDRPGVDDVLAALRGSGVASRPAASAAVAASRPASTIKWLSYADGVERARIEKRRLFIDFYADW